MAISHVDTTTATQANSTSATATKPTGTASGDLLLAFFTSNSQNATAPSGWTQIFDTTIEVFRTQVFRKVAGSSEPSNYQFSVGSPAPLVLSITALRGGDSATPLDVTTQFDSSTTSSEPHTTPSVTGGTSGRLVYFRGVRRSGTTVPTFTASGVTELSDVGVFSGGSICYAQGLYLANSDYSGSGTKSGLGITCSQSESHNIVATIGVKAASIPGDVSIDIPSIPDATASGEVSVPAELDADLPLLGPVEAEAFHGDPEATLDAQIPVSMEAAGTTDSGGPLAAVIVPMISFLGEARRFAENIVSVKPDERWLVITQDGYYLGTREAVRDFPIFVVLPELQASISGNVSALGLTVPADVVAYDAGVVSQSFSESASASAVANDAFALTGYLGDAGEASATASASDATVQISSTAELASASAVAIDAPLTQGATELAASTVVANDSAALLGATPGEPAFAGVAAYGVTAGIGPSAGEVSAFVAVYHAYGVEAPAGGATASVTANNVKVKIGAAPDFARATVRNIPDNGVMPLLGVAMAAKKVNLVYAANIGNGSSTSFTVTHNLGSRDVVTCVYEAASPYEEVQPTSIEHTTADSLTVTFPSAPSNDQYRVVVIYG